MIFHFNIAKTLLLVCAHLKLTNTCFLSFKEKKNQVFLDSQIIAKHL